jgi:hypothetical protein
MSSAPVLNTRFSKFFFYLAQRSNVGQGHLFHEVSKSHLMTHHSRQNSTEQGIGLSPGPVPDNTQHSQQTDIHAPRGIRIRNPSKRSAVDTRLRPLGHWDYLLTYSMQQSPS